MACRWQPGMKITALLDVLNSALAEPFALAWSQDSPRFLLVLTVVYAVAVIVAVTDQKNTRPGAEHGSAAWGDVFRLNKFYMDKRGPNLLLTQHFHIGIDGYKHKHNTNILIVGGSGAGKTRTYGVPNVLECACSMVITDPKSEILRKTGNLLKQKGYEVLVFDLINPAASFCYNPFVYVHDDREVLTLIENLIQNTTPSHSKSSDPFWEKSETALLQALMLYLLHEAPPEEQNFSMVIYQIPIPFLSFPLTPLLTPGQRLRRRNGKERKRRRARLRYTRKSSRITSAMTFWYRTGSLTGNALTSL